MDFVHLSCEVVKSLLALSLDNDSLLLLEVSGHLEVPRVVLPEALVQQLSQVTLRVIYRRKLEVLECLDVLGFLDVAPRLDVLADVEGAARPVLRPRILVLVQTELAGG